MLEVQRVEAGLEQRADLERIRAERDLYLRLLDLGAQDDLDCFLKEALALVTGATGAQCGYFELQNPSGGEPDWYAAHGFSARETEDVRSLVSHGIIAEALATGRIVDTPSALLDPRFSERGSVRARLIEAVLCIPIGEGPPLGVLYLQGRAEPGPFGEGDRQRAQLFARHAARLAEPLLLRLEGGAGHDPTRALRRTLRLDGVVGRSPALAALLREVALVSPLEVSVLLLGHSGTGKSQIARVIHDNGPRARHPFVELNCGALPETLVESELFGAEAGAHSTATRTLPGKVAAAQGGTLFLDEVGALPRAAQAKLLQLLQSKHYYRLGASQPSQADVRLIAATNLDLEEAVAEGRFRDDLYYRLKVLPLRLPSLEERRADVPELARHFCREACARHGLPHLELSTDALRAAEGSEWPGQVRQLAHAVEAAAIRAAGEGVTRIERRHLWPPAPGQQSPDAGSPTFQEATRRFQADLLCEVLEETGWNVSETARRLELARSHVYNLIRAFGLRRKSGD